MAGPRTRQDNSEGRRGFEEDVISQLGGEEEEEEELDEGGEEEEEEGDEGEGGEEEEEEEGEEEEELEVKVKPDKRGNLIDPKTNRIIAPAGAARRFYEEAVNAKRQVASLLRDQQTRDGLLHQARDALIAMKSQLDGVSSTSDTGKELGLTPQEQVEFLHLAAQWKDPTKAMDTLRYLLTKAVQRGIDIKPLGAGGGSFDPSVIVNDLAKKVEASLKPINDRFAESEKVGKARADAEQEIRTFTANNPAAVQYLPVLGEILKNPRFAAYGLNGAWLLLQNHLLRKHVNTRQQSRTRPSGRARPGAPDAGGHIDDTPASVDLEFRDILKGVIRDYGEIE